MESDATHSVRFVPLSGECSVVECSVLRLRIQFFKHFPPGTLDVLAHAGTDGENIIHFQIDCPADGVSLAALIAECHSSLAQQIFKDKYGAVFQW